MEKQSSFVDLCTLHQHAMRYYKLWIYCCNVTLSLATLVFIIFSASVLVDERIGLVSDFSLANPTIIYSLFVLLFQSVFLQIIGCIGALKLNPRILKLYWNLLFFLLVSDLVVGSIWILKLERIKLDLKSNLKGKVSQLKWVERHDKCCGVEGPEDYALADSNVTLTLPDACCSVFEEPILVTEDPSSQIPTYQQTYDLPPLKKRKVKKPLDRGRGRRSPLEYLCRDPAHTPHSPGCYSKILFWLNNVSDVLLIIGFCIIVFIKLCFLFILKYEITEMIEKIKLLNSSSLDEFSGLTTTTPADK